MNQPIEPPMAIICRCRPFSFLARGDSAVALAAASTSKTLPLAPTTPLGVQLRLGSLRKPSMMRWVRFGLGTGVSSSLGTPKESNSIEPDSGEGTSAVI